MHSESTCGRFLIAALGLDLGTAFDGKPKEEPEVMDFYLTRGGIHPRRDFSPPTG